ncbi:MAG: membrane protein insertase YidC [Candidatus Aminicenantes bacterium]|nr:membrane protein insertase YidC [Candidatus Aminicenantes bacterium]
MEKRLLIAIVLSFLVLLLYQILFVKKKPLPESLPESAREEIIVKKDTAPPPLEAPAQEQLRREEKEILPTSEEVEKEIRVETSLYEAVWSNRGGVLKSWKLKEHQDEEKNNLELVSYLSAETDTFPFSLGTEDPAFDRVINTSLYESTVSRLDLREGRSGEMRFEYADEQGNFVEKTFIFQDGQYHFDTKIKLIKNRQEIEPRLIWGPSFSNPSLTEQKQRFGVRIGIAVKIADKVYRNDESKFKPELREFSYAEWAAYENNYFAALFFIPPQKYNVEFIRKGEEATPQYFLSMTSPQKIYLGPKEMERLTALGFEAKKLIKFGLFGFIAEILLKGMKFIHKAVPNWGVTIIIMTLIVKIIFFPLTYSSTRSMARMQELQPKIKALRAKYKKAKQDIAQRRKMNEEMMRLYKEHGINPAGGCLPMLIQLPVFWGFFRLLVIAIEFRHSPFFLWIKDLSVKDPYYVTPILMGVTQYISQKMTPTSADPTQARMMLIMPVIMTILFMNFQSGLVLYWLTNNILQIGQQAIMNRISKKKKREAHGKRRKK